MALTRRSRGGMTGWVAAALLALGVLAALGNGQQDDVGDTAVDATTDAPVEVTVELPAGD